MFIDVMLADKLPDVPYNPDKGARLRSQLELAKLKAGEWVYEPKLDGHRITVLVGGAGQQDLLSTGKSVRAWSREGRPRILPRHITDVLADFPEGRYDGELFVPGKRSYGVTELVNASELIYMVFDIMETMGESVMNETMWNRRKFLHTIFNQDYVREQTAVHLAPQWLYTSIEDTVARCCDIWAQDGEGLIIKRITGTYRPKKRSKDWLKAKDLIQEVMTVIGYVAGLEGPYARVLLQDSKGRKTTVKVLNTVERNKLAANPAYYIGRRLVVEFQERTPDGSPRHGRWDRWEDE